MRNLYGVCAVAFHTQGQGFAACQQQKCILRRDGGAKVAQAQHTAGDGKGNVAERLVHLETMITLTRLRHGGVVARRRPVKRACIHQNAAHGIAMTTNELGQRVHNNVGTVLNGAAEIRRGHGVIDDQRNARVLGNGGNRINVLNNAAGVGNGLHEDGSRLWPDGGLHGGSV